MSTDHYTGKGSVPKEASRKRPSKRRSTFSNIFDNNNSSTANNTRPNTHGAVFSTVAAGADPIEGDDESLGQHDSTTNHLGGLTDSNSNSQTNLHNYGVIDQRVFTQNQPSSRRRARRRRSSKAKIKSRNDNSMGDGNTTVASPVSPISAQTTPAVAPLLRQNLQKYQKSGGYSSGNVNEDDNFSPGPPLSTRTSRNAYADRWVRNQPSLEDEEPSHVPASSTSDAYASFSVPPLENGHNYNSFSFRSKRRLSTVAGLSPSNKEYFPSNHSNDNLEDLFDSDYEFEGSQPSTKTNQSDNSSLDDVCLPIDQSDGEEGDEKMWPDLKVLQEFYNEEIEELRLLAESNSKQAHDIIYLDNNNGGNANLAPSSTNYYDDIEENNYIYNNNDDDQDHVVGFQSPIISKVDVTNERQPLLSHRRVNETEGLNGRLRPPKIHPWDKHGMNSNIGNLLGFPGAVNLDNRLADQFRFAYFREDLDTTIHSPTISGILQPGQTFADLFVPCHYMKNKPGSENSALFADENVAVSSDSINNSNGGNDTNNTRGSTPIPSQLTDSGLKYSGSKASANDSASSIFWLDILNPTEEEMKVVSKAFGIHPLTTEDIFLGETREKVELFNDYYFICFRSFDIVREKMKIKEKNELHFSGADDDELYKNYHTSMTERIKILVKKYSQKLWSRKHDAFKSDEDSGNYRRFPVTSKDTTSTITRKRQYNSKKDELQPLNIYIIVFREGVLTFHFAPTPHPVNVRRRCRLLRDYLTVSTDWIAYALIDDITDAFGPMIELLEGEVGTIEDEIIKMQSGEDSDSELESEMEDDEEEEDELEKAYTKKMRPPMLSRNNPSSSSAPYYQTAPAAAQAASTSAADKRSVRSVRSMRSGRSIASSSSSSSASSMSTTTSMEWQRKGDMLRRIGESRKKVMSLLRLLGSKADVIKGFSKKCNENFAPKSDSLAAVNAANAVLNSSAIGISNLNGNGNSISNTFSNANGTNNGNNNNNNSSTSRSEIGMYLGDIQDHIITMVQTLNHCEKLLARSHSNYLAQLNIDMTKVNNDMNDVLGKLTILGTIVLPMNVITGLWGMNVVVPGQFSEGLWWFFSITACMFLFALLLYVVCRRIGVA